jgi:hypothetical protein
MEEGISLLHVCFSRKFTGLLSIMIYSNSNERRGNRLQLFGHTLTLNPDYRRKPTGGNVK